MTTTSAVPEWVPTDNHGVRTLPCGRWFDAVRVSSNTAFYGIARLHDRSGPVIEDQVQQILTWLIHPATAEGWCLPGVKVVGRGRYVAVPPASWVKGSWWGAPSTRWLIPPRGSCLTDAKYLHDALAEVIGGPVEGGILAGYRSPECCMNDHEACTKAEAPPPPRESSVIYEACDCPCHEALRRALRRISQTGGER
ncbi:hypothetical protein [Streptomyces sp. URMC 129]|uniref:hypothetical protein n=1 Tax=Streptomyces sp. URMC 129 TaxID=3423407 RepID=UPI003F1CF61E